MPRRIVVLLALLACANLLLLAVAEASSGRATARGAGTVVAVVDTGVAPLPRFEGRLLPTIDLVGDGGRDAEGHGTAVAAVLAESCPRCTILPVRVLRGDTAAPWARIAAGIVAAVDAGARVVNVSIAGPGGSPELRRAVEYAAARDVLVVAAAGNTGLATPQYPAAYAGVVGVRAAAGTWSAHGRWTDVAADGCAEVPVPRGGVGLACGTSFAAPRVAALAALARGARPTAAAREIAKGLPRALAPAATPAVVVTGTATPGSVVRARTTTPLRAGSSLRWFRCDGAACTAVGGASYRVRGIDATSTLVARVVTQPFGRLWAAESAPLAVR